MPKDIKAIQCPHCGSIYKTETKPGFYRCQNCGTEYYLDNDDLHIYHHYGPDPRQATPLSNVGKKTPVYTLIIAVFIMVIAYLVIIRMQPQGRLTSNLTTYKIPRLYYVSYLYTNSESGNPVYLRIGMDQIDKGNDQQEKGLHAQYNDASDGHLIADRIMDQHIIKQIPPYLQFQVLSNRLVYMLANNMVIFRLNTRDNDLTDITQRSFKNFPQLSSGIAKIDFEMDKDVFTVLNNEGNNFYYFPVTGQLAANAEEMYSIAKGMAKMYYFEFGTPDNLTNTSGKEILREVKYWPEGKQYLYRNFTTNRIYYHPQLLYQDDNDLLIATNTTPANDPPVSLQDIDAHTGKVKWAYPPVNTSYTSACKCKQGFAVEYRTGQESDYIHGVLVISSAGKLIHDHQLKRTE